ncbi:Collagen alpha-1(XXI) chain, partial [Frankliniella fusca]
ATRLSAPSPLLAAVAAGAAVLTLAFLVAAVALCRRRLSSASRRHAHHGAAGANGVGAAGKPPPPPSTPSLTGNHLIADLEGLDGLDGLGIAPTPSASHSTFRAAGVRGPLDDTDPDVIPSIYGTPERRPPKHTFATLNCRTPQQRRRKKGGEFLDEDDAAFDEFDAKTCRLTPITAMATLGRAPHGPRVARLPPAQIERPPPAFSTKEVSLCTSPSRPLSINNIVTTSHKIQESCI